jgi:thiopurine S-methyltransferase
MPVDWLKKWQDGETRFHQSSVHPSLSSHVQVLPKGKVFVPLCGKSLDMLFLLERGYEVAGVELSPLACRDFFLENKLPYVIKSIGDFTLYQGEKITLWCGDYFKLPEEAWDNITGVYDRAALVALPKDLRIQYTKEMSSRLAPGNPVLLISYEYQEGEITGPPFSVTHAEIDALFLSSEKEVLEKVSEAVRDVEVTEITYLIKLEDKA